jgi:chloramphenicol 3-O phosphotransferase
MIPPPVIYLHGTSSSGKSSIARELKNLYSGSEHFESDVFEVQFERSVRKEDATYLAVAQRYGDLDHRLRTVKDFSQKSKLFDELYELVESLPFPDEFNSEKAMYEQIYELNTQGTMVIVDDVIPVRRIFIDCLRILRECYVYFIRVDCSLAELRRRELARGDRIEGAAEYWCEKIHSDKVYDFSVNSSSNDPLSCALQVREHVNSQTPKAFTINRQRLSVG